MHPLSKNKLVALAGAAASAAALVGCQVTVDSGPSAVPPAITWTVTEVGGSATQFGANGALNIQLDKTYDVSAHAQSPSAVKSLTVGGSGGWGCRSGDVASSTTDDLATQTSQQQVQDGKASDTLFTFQTIGVGGNLCQSGYSFTGGGFSLVATAKNFAGMTTSGHLTLTITP